MLLLMFQILCTLAILCRFSSRGQRESNDVGKGKSRSRDTPSGQAANNPVDHHLVEGDLDEGYANLNALTSAKPLLETFDLHENVPQPAEKSRSPLPTKSSKRQNVTQPSFKEM